jgi:hypothetical protein
MATFHVTYVDSTGQSQTATVTGPYVPVLPGLAGVAVAALIDRTLGLLALLGVAGVDLIALVEVKSSLPPGARILSLTTPDGQTLQLGPGSTTGALPPGGAGAGTGGGGGDAGYVP